MKIRKNGSVVYNSIDNTGSTDASALGARYAKGRMDSTDNNLANNYYTKDQTLSLIEEAIDEADILKTMVVAQVPTVTEAATNIIYLVPAEGEEHVYQQYKKVLVSQNPDTYTMALLGSTEVEVEDIQTTELPHPNALMANRVMQYIGNVGALERGRFYWCKPTTYYAWTRTGDPATVYTLSRTPVADDPVYTITTAGTDVVATEYSKVASVASGNMTDNKGGTYAAADGSNVTSYAWVPLFNKLSEFQNDGDGTSPFVTKNYADALVPSDVVTEPDLENYYTKAQVDLNIDRIYDQFASRKRSLHILVRYNNDSKEYPMGWIAIVTANTTETYSTFAKWLYDKNYKTMQKCYAFVGGCLGTTGVASTSGGTAYVGRVGSGAFSTDGTTITFKWDYNGTTVAAAARCGVVSFPLS